MVLSRRMAAVYLVLVTLVATFHILHGAPTSKPTASPCHAQAMATCSHHSNANTIYCTSDGKKYHGLCAFLTAYCDKHMTIVGTGENCTHPTRPPPTTPPPPTPFEAALFSDITHGIDDRLMASLVKGVPASKSLPIFSTQNHTSKVYVRNPDCWAFDLDLTPLSPWNSNGHNRKAGTLISPRHAVWARHYSIRLNSTIRFVDRHNQVVDRRVVSSHTVTGSGLHSFYGQDIVVGELDRDVPASIGFAKVMPRNLTTFRAPYSAHLPALSTDQEEKALVDDFSYYSATTAGLRAPPTASIRHKYYESKIGGDSGNPTFFVIRDQLVLLFVFTTGGAGGGTSVNHYYDNINHIMGLRGSKHRLTQIDVSGYPHAGHTFPAIIGVIVEGPKDVALGACHLESPGNVQQEAILLKYVAVHAIYRVNSLALGVRDSPDRIPILITHFILDVQVHVGQV